MGAGPHKASIERKLSIPRLNASIDPEWNKLRPACASDPECEARVLLSLFEMEIRALRERLEARPPTIDSRDAYPLLATYQKSVDMATADLTRATASTGLTTTRTRRAADCDDGNGEYRRADGHPRGTWWTD